jgi:hypothetical protein
LESVTGTEQSGKTDVPKERNIWRPSMRLVQRRTLWCPTWLGFFCLVLFLAAPAIWWLGDGESFLSLTERRPAEVLVVEGWIGRDGIRAAAAEFMRRGYRYVVATGGLTNDERWSQGGWSYAEGAQHELIRSGVPEAQILVATARDVESQRTFESAIAVSRALQARGIHPKALNVFTWGDHARRSRLVFAKVFQPDTNVGVVSWTPAIYGIGPWWKSSSRAKELLAETAGFIYEALFNSGRSSNSPDKDLPPGMTRQPALGTKISDSRWTQFVGESVVPPATPVQTLNGLMPAMKMEKTNGCA